MRQLETTINITETTTGLDEILFGQYLSVYPNPSTGRITLAMDNDYNGSMDLIIHDPSGKQVRKITRNKTTPYWEDTIDLEDMNPGIYVLEVHWRQKVKTYKLIVN